MVTFDALITDSYRRFTVYSGVLQKEVNIMGKDPSRSDTIIVYYDDKSNTNVPLPIGTEVPGWKVDVADTHIATGDALELTIEVRGPEIDHPRNWDVKAGGPSFKIVFTEPTFVLISGPNGGQSKNSKPKERESVMIDSDAKPVTEPLVAGSSILLLASWFEIKPNQLGRDGHSRGTLYILKGS